MAKNQGTRTRRPGRRAAPLPPAQPGTGPQFAPGEIQPPAAPTAAPSPAPAARFATPQAIEAQAAGLVRAVARVGEAWVAAKEKLKQQLGALQIPGVAYAAQPQPRVKAFAEGQGPQPVLGRENIVGFAIGEKRVEGQYTGQKAVKVYVREKTDNQDRIEENAFIEPYVEVDGQRFPTDVHAVGVISTANVQSFRRPVWCGMSIGHGPTGRTGTYGAMVMLNDGSVCMLTNQHVIGPIPHWFPSNVNDRVIQPGALDGGQNSDQYRVGLVLNYSNTKFHPQQSPNQPQSPDPSLANQVDAAVAWAMSYQTASP